jgi:hypothetical protein
VVTIGTIRPFSFPRMRFRSSGPRCGLLALRFRPPPVRASWTGSGLLPVPVSASGPGPRFLAPGFGLRPPVPVSGLLRVGPLALWFRSPASRPGLRSLLRFTRAAVAAWPSRSSYPPFATCGPHSIAAGGGPQIPRRPAVGTDLGRQRTGPALDVCGPVMAQQLSSGLTYPKTVAPRIGTDPRRCQSKVGFFNRGGTCRRRWTGPSWVR